MVVASIAYSYASDYFEEMAQPSFIFLDLNIGRPCPFLPTIVSLLPAFISDSICIPRCAFTSTTLILIPFSLGSASLFETFALLGQPCAT